MSFYFPIPMNEVKSKSEYDCKKCGLKANKINSPEIDVYIGKNYDGLVILGQKPSKTDDEKNKPFADKRSAIIRSVSFKSKVRLSDDAAFLHAVTCYNPSKKKPTSETQYRCCQTILHNRLKELRPKFIICCGEMAFKMLFNMKNKMAISKLRNRLVPNYEYNCLVFPVYDPYNHEMYHSKGDDEDLNYYYQHAYKWDLERAFKLWSEVFYRRNEVKKLLQERKILENITITEVTCFDEAKKLFALWNECKAIAVDYETTNLFPYDNHFEIIYIAFGNKTNAWVFHESFWKNKPIVLQWFKQQMVHILTNEKVCKVIQNSKFEDLASRFVLGIEGIKNAFCTMLATHVVDEREGCTSLDFQNLVRFGIPPYSDKIKKYLETNKKSIESDDLEDDVDYTFQKVNKIREAPRGDMVQYNGLDVITAFNQYLLFKNELMDSYPLARKNYQFLYDGHCLFADMSQRGINIGEEELNTFESFLDEQIEQIEERIESIPEVIFYNKHLETKTGKEKKNRNEKDLENLCFSKPKRKSLRSKS